MEYLKKTFKCSSTIVARYIDDEVIIVPIGGDLARQGEIYNLEGTAAEIWRLFDGKKNVAQIRNSIVETMTGAGEQVETDLIEFIKDLENVRAIEEVG